MDILFTQPYWDYFVISFVTIGLVFLMRLALKRYDPPDADPSGLIARRQKEQNQAFINQMFEQRDSTVESEITGASFSDLTVGDLRTLIKDFFFYCFVIFLIFGIPYIAFQLGVGLLKAVFPRDTYSSLNWIAGLGILVIIMVMLLKDPAYTIAWIGVLFRDMSNSMSRLSRTKQVLLLAGIIGYFYLAFAYPYVWIILTLCLMPFEFTYGRYRAILKAKAQVRSTS